MNSVLVRAQLASHWVLPSPGWPALFGEISIVIIDDIGVQHDERIAIALPRHLLRHRIDGAASRGRLPEIYVAAAMPGKRAPACRADPGGTTRLAPTSIHGNFLAII